MRMFCCSRKRRHTRLVSDWSSYVCSSVLRSLPGVVHVAHISYRPALAEMLVHELSHQHYYVASSHGPVDDGSDDNLYYSPEIGRAACRERAESTGDDGDRDT